MLGIFDIVVGIGLCVCGVLYYLNKKNSFWNEHGIAHPKPALLYGNIERSKQRKHVTNFIQKHYDAFSHRYPLFGVYIFTKPLLMITDLELLKNVFVKDFQYFHDRGVYHNEKDDPLSANLFNIEGQKWKTLRNKLSPSFTSGKIKLMFPTIDAAGKQFKDYLQEMTTQESEFEMKDLFARFTTDVIGTCAFGIECNSMKNPNCEFREMGRKVFTPIGRLQSLLITIAPRLARLLGVRLLHSDVADFFMQIVRKTVDYRLANRVQRNDFMDLLIKMRNINERTSDEETLSFNEIAAQAYIFFLAGFETSSTMLTWALYELAMNTELQEKARQCIKDGLNRHNGQLTYEAVLDMKYLDQVFNESLRKYPPVPIHFRATTKDYPVPNTELVLPAGTAVWIPVHSIQNDPAIFPNPEKFDPERFSPGEEAKRHPYAFIPFGEGPRVCIGVRFGMIQAKLGLVYLLSGFKFHPCARTPTDTEFDVDSFVPSSPGGMWLNVQKI